MKLSLFLITIFIAIDLSRACSFWQDDWVNGLPCSHRLYPTWRVCCRHPRSPGCNIFYPHLWRFVRESASVSVSREVTTTTTIATEPLVTRYHIHGDIADILNDVDELLDEADAIDCHDIIEVDDVDDCNDWNLEGWDGCNDWGGWDGCNNWGGWDGCNDWNDYYPEAY